MTTSGTFNFAPTVGELVINAYGRLNIRGPALLASHWYDARIESNLIQITWANKGVNLWTVDLQSISLSQGTATYTVPTNTMAVLDTYITTNAAGVNTDRIITGISRSDYASLTNKAVQGPPTSFWFDRLISPTITVWPVPDNNGPYTLNFYRYRLIQDAIIPGGVQPELPIRWLPAWTADLAHALSRQHAPQLEAQRKVDAAEAWQIAAYQDVEMVPIRIQPMIGAYYRRR